MKSTIFLYPVISKTKQQGQKKKNVMIFSPIISYRFVEDIQHLDGAVFTGSPRHIHSLDVRRVVEIDQFFGDLWIIRSGDGVFNRHSNKQRRFTRGAEKEHQRRHQTCCEPWLCVCVLTVSLFMKPQIAAATSQANRITKKKKNYKSKIFILTSVTPKIKILYLEKKCHLWTKRYTHCAQKALRFLNGTITSKEAHKHHNSSHSYQYVHTCKRTVSRKLSINGLKTFDLS